MNKIKENIFLVMSLGVVIFDLSSKYFANQIMIYGKDYEFTKLISFNLICNKMEMLYSFGFDFGDYATLVQKTIYILFCIFLLVLFNRLVKSEVMNKDNNAYLLKAGLAILLGCELANLFDYLLTGGVTDFISYNAKDGSSQIFNIADLLVIFGNLMIVIGIIKITTAGIKNSFLKKINKCCE